MKYQLRPLFLLSNNLFVLTVFPIVKADFYNKIFLAVICEENSHLRISSYTYTSFMC